MRTLGLHAYVRIAKSRQELVARRGYVSDGAESPIDLYLAIASNEPELFRPMFSWESTTRPSTLIDALLTRWLRIYRPHITVSQYNDLVMSLASKYSGNAGSVYKAVSIRDRHKKLVFAVSRIEGRDVRWMAATNAMTRRLWDSKKRLERRKEIIREIQDRYYACDSCKELMTKNDYWNSAIRRKPIQLSGSGTRAQNYMRKHLGFEMQYFCMPCYSKIRNRMAVITESETIRQETKSIRKAMKQ